MGKILNLCDQSHQWESVKKNTKCPFCNNRKALEGFNDFGCLYPNLLSEWSRSNEFSPHDFPCGSNKMVEWICANSHIWNAPIVSRTKGSGCRKCFFENANKIDLWNNRKTVLLKDERPSLASEIVDENIRNNISFSSHKKIDWKCSLGHLYKLSPNVRLGGRGCPYCANRKVLVGFNTIAAIIPEKTSELVNPSDENLPHWSRVRVKWRHTTDDGIEHIWEMSPSSRVNGSGCLICVCRILVPGINDVATTHPEIAAQWSSKNTIRSTEVTRGSNELVELICPKGHEWTSRVKNATSMSKVCIDCKPTSDYFRSKAEIELCNFVETLTEVENSVKRFKKYGIYEIDIFCPNEKIAIDYNGIYYHQDEFKGEGYHEAKREAIAGRGFHHIEVWEDAWKSDKGSIIESVHEILRKIIEDDGVNTPTTKRHFEIFSTVDRLAK